MTTLTGWTFTDARGALRAETALATLAAREPITVDDAALVTWTEGRSRPRTRQLHHLARTAAVNDAFWGLLFGVVLYLPLLGARGAASSTCGGSLCEVGLDDEAIDRIRSTIREGTSALFLITAPRPAARIRAVLDPLGTELVRSDLTPVQERTMRTVFAP